MLKWVLENCFYFFFLRLSVMICCDFFLVTNVLIVSQFSRCSIIRPANIQLQKLFWAKYTPIHTGHLSSLPSYRETPGSAVDSWPEEAPEVPEGLLPHWKGLPRFVSKTTTPPKFEDHRWLVQWCRDHNVWLRSRGQEILCTMKWCPDTNCSSDGFKLPSR